MHVNLCLEQEYAGYYGMKTTLDCNPKITYLHLTSGHLTSAVFRAVSHRKSKDLGKFFTLLSTRAYIENARSLAGEEAHTQWRDKLRS